MYNKITPSGMDEETWHKFVREVESVVEKYYPEQCTTTDKKTQIKQTLEIIAMYMGGVVAEAMSLPISKENLVQMLTQMYQEVSPEIKSETLH
tara:strand:- start:1793 stop:2071 length:279 start_codon:yes stop_codon:yes gene_type:complete